MSKVDYVSLFIEECELDVVVVGETWLVPDVASSFVAVEGFTLVRGDTNSLVRKHGVCIYIRDCLGFEEVAVAGPNVAAVHLVQYDLWILSVYRPPSYGGDDNGSLIDSILSFCEGREVIVVGDFNLPSLSWPADGLELGVSRVDQSFLDCFISAGLTQWVDEATFVSSGNILDLFLTSETDRVGSVELLAPFPRCSHCPVVCSYLFGSDLDVARGEIVSVGYSWHRGNYYRFSEALSYIDWEVELAHRSADAAYECFLGHLSELVGIYVPVCEGRGAIPWSTNPPPELRKSRSRAWNSYKSVRASWGRDDNRALAALEVFNTVNSQFRHYVRNSRAQYEGSLMERYSDSPKLFHSYVRRKKKGRMGVGPLRRLCGQLVDSPGEMAQLLVATFASVFIERDPENPAPYQSCLGEMEDFVITADEVYSVLSNLDANSAMGPDDVHPRLLKSCAEQLAMPLAVVFNLSLEAGSLPGRWLESIVIPLFKGKSRYNASNYRPVSLTSVCCKVMERIIVAKLMAYLESAGILSERQFGFRKARSTEDQMLLVYSEVAELVDRGFVVDMALLDFSKAFDVVSHVVLVEKLRALGVAEVLLRWVRGFLVGRTMRVSVDRVCSGSRDVLSGVPQGSVLGPVLFLVYVNCLTDGLVSNFGAFADDYKIYMHYSRREVLEETGMACLQSDLDRVYTVSSSWNLSLNPDKCVVLRFSRRFVGLAELGGGVMYSLGGSELQFSEAHRDLGVLVDTKLKFHVHVRDVVRKAAGLCNSLLRSTVNRTPQFMVTLFVTHVRPILDYCSTVWCVGYAGDLNLLEAVQRRWTKQVEGLQNVEYGARLRTLGLFSVQGRFLRSDLIKYWRILCSDSAGYDLSIMFRRAVHVGTRGHSHRLVIPLCASDMRKRFFNVRRIKVWNSLPSAVVESLSLSGFKGSLAQFLGDELFDY
jgi:hypothetical protein